MADRSVGRLSSHHAGEAFSCDNASLDVFLKTLAGLYEKRRLGKTFVAVRAEENIVCGYYNSADGSLDLSPLPETQRNKSPKHPLPTVHLGSCQLTNTIKGRDWGKPCCFTFSAPH